jgi:hypothetical protein
LGGNCARVNADRGLAKREETTDVAGIIRARAPESREERVVETVPH